MDRTGPARWPLVFTICPCTTVPRATRKLAHFTLAACGGARDGHSGSPLWVGVCVSEVVVAYMHQVHQSVCQVYLYMCMSLHSPRAGTI